MFLEYCSSILLISLVLKYVQSIHDLPGKIVVVSQCQRKSFTIIFDALSFKITYSQAFIITTRMTMYDSYEDFLILEFFFGILL